MAFQAYSFSAEKAFSSIRRTGICASSFKLKKNSMKSSNIYTTVVSKVCRKNLSGMNRHQSREVNPISQLFTHKRITCSREVGTAAAPHDIDSDTDPVSARNPASSEGIFAPIRKGAQARLEADKDFFFKLGAECSVDQVISLLANMSTFGLNPLTWATTSLASALLCHFTAIMNDVILVWFLAPVAGKKDTKTLISHCFQEGEGITVTDRFMCIFRKFKLYGPVGVTTALLARIMILLITSQPIIISELGRTATIGFVHLGVSSNLRYQTVNGIEVILSKALPPALARVGTVCIRTGNNFLGARIFLFLAGLL